MWHCYQKVRINAGGIIYNLQRHVSWCGKQDRRTALNIPSAWCPPSAPYCLKVDVTPVNRLLYMTEVKRFRRYKFPDQLT